MRVKRPETGEDRQDFDPGAHYDAPVLPVKKIGTVEYR
jgi:hypothetical protein